MLCLVSLRQNGVGPNKTCADAILPKGHIASDLLLILRYRKDNAKRTRMVIVHGCGAKAFSCTAAEAIAWYRASSILPALLGPGDDRRDGCRRGPCHRRLRAP